MNPIITALLAAAAVSIVPVMDAMAASPEETTISGTADAYTAAPMPDPDIGAPAKPAQGTKPYVSATLYQPRDQFRGDGYTWKDSSQVVMERNLQPTPTMLVKVPLHNDDN